MRRVSPHEYAFNNPLRFTDPDGMIPNDVALDGLTKNFGDVDFRMASQSSEANFDDSKGRFVSTKKKEGTGDFNAFKNNFFAPKPTGDSNIDGDNENLKGTTSGSNLYSEHSATFRDQQVDVMLAKNIAPASATFRIDGTYSVEVDETGVWRVSVAASGDTHMKKHVTVQFFGSVNMTVDGKVTQTQNLSIPSGMTIGPNNPFSPIGSATMKLPDSGIVQVNLSIRYFVQFGSKGNRWSTTYQRTIPIRTIGLPRK